MAADDLGRDWMPAPPDEPAERADDEPTDTPEDGELIPDVRNDPVPETD